MSVTAILELKVKPDQVDAAPEIFHRTLADTRAFDGCVSVTVSQAHDDLARFIVVETWASLEHDSAYRAWRAGQPSDLADLLAEPPRLTVGLTREDI